MLGSIIDAESSRRERIRALDGQVAALLAQLERQLDNHNAES